MAQISLHLIKFDKCILHIVRAKAVLSRIGGEKHGVEIGVRWKGFDLYSMAHSSWVKAGKWVKIYFHATGGKAKSNKRRPRI